jgi:hypothetical protein
MERSTNENNSESPPISEIHEIPATEFIPLMGELVFAGDLVVNGEEMSGCALIIDRATLIASNTLPMYQKCVIIPVKEFTRMENEKSIH